MVLTMFKFENVDAALTSIFVGTVIKTHRV